MINDPIHTLKVSYVAIERESGRTCNLYPWQVANPEWIADWNRDWDVKTIVTADSVLAAGEVVYGDGATDLTKRIAGLHNQLDRLQNQLEEMRSDRDTWKALANG